MKLNVFAGTTLIPTLSRLVLALAFITAGYQKVTGTSEFTAEQMTVLQGIGIPLTEAAPESTAWSPSETGAGVRAVLASLKQDDPVQDPPPDEEEEVADDPETAGAGDAQATDEDEVQETPPPVVEPPPTAERVLEPPVIRVDLELPEEDPVIDNGAPQARYEGRSLWHVAYLCETRGLPVPKQMAWVAALTELIGGSLLLIGFLSRIWGLGLAIAMGTAVYLTSLDPYLATGPFAVAAGDHVLFNMVFSQLGLGLLAFGILLTGAGPLSLDRVIFRRRSGTTSSALAADDYETEI